MLYLSLFCSLFFHHQYSGPSLKVVSSFSVGLDHIDVGAARKRGVKIGHTPDVLTDAVSELAIGLILATSRRFFEARDEITKYVGTDYFF